MELFNSKNSVFWSLESEISRNDLLKKISSNLEQNNEKINDSLVLMGFIERENQITTGLGDKLAMPHTKVKNLDEPKLFFIKSKIGIDWNSLDGDLVNFVIAILVPENSSDLHLKIISSISSVLLDEKRKEKIFNARNIKEIISELNIEKEEKQSEILSEQFDIVAVTSCTSGLAHTFLSRDALIKSAKKAGKTIKVETRGADGIKNKLTNNEIRNANKLIIAVDKETDLEGYENPNTIFTKTFEVVKNPDKFIESKDFKNEKNIFLLSYEKLFTSLITASKNVFGLVRLLLPILGILLMLDVYFGVSNENTTLLKQIINSFIMLIVPIVSGFIAKTISKNDESFMIATFVAFLGCHVSFLNLEKVNGGLLLSIIVGLLVGCLIKLTNEKILNLKFTISFIRPLIKMIIELAIIASLGFIVFNYLGPTFQVFTESIYKLINSVSERHWWFNSITVAVFGILYCIDCGRTLNKWTMTITILVLIDSLAVDVNKPWLYPFTASLFSAAIPNFVLGLSILSFKKNYSKDDIEEAKKAVRDGFRPITESSIPIVNKYGLKAKLSYSFAIIFGSIFIGLFGFQFYGGLSSPLGFILGVMYVPNPYLWGSVWILIYTSSIILGSIIFATLTYRKKEVIYE